MNRTDSDEHAVFHSTPGSSLSPSDAFGARRLVAVWFADVVGFTRLASVDEDAALEVVAELHRVARSEVERHGGRVVKLLGDGALAEFDSADSAARAALAVRRGFGSSGEGREAAALRIGIHLGDVLASPDGDLYGDGVNTASRIHGTAAPGEVVVSDDVWRQLRRRPGFQFQSLGERPLRGLDEPVTVHRLLSAPERSERDSSAEEPKPLRRSLSRRSIAIMVAAVAVAISLTGLVAWSLREPPGAIAVAGVVEPAPTIAVLPFENMSSDPEQEFFSDGLTEELLNVLAQVPGLRVAARTSSFAFKGTNVPIDSIGRALRVAHIVEGSVRKVDGRVRIKAQLIDAATGYQLWSRSYDRELVDIFAVQDEISRAIADQLRVDLAGDAPLAKQETADPEAHALVLRGRAVARQGTPESYVEAVGLYRQAIERDPEYARAHALLADRLMWQAYFRYIPREGYEEARAAVDRALALDPELAIAHTVRGVIANLHDWDFSRADEHFLRSLSLGPGDPAVHYSRALLLMRLGRREEAIQAAHRAVELDPLSFAEHNLGLMYLYAGRTERAAEAFEAALALAPDSPHVLANLARAYSWLGRHADAIRTVERARARAPGAHVTLASLAQVYALAGRGSEAERALATLLEQPEVSPFRVATVHAALGDRERTLAMLEKAVEERDDHASWLAVTPEFDGVRDDPRFERLLRRAGLR
ncbi:MAG: adenylate/guanylate cyclase domain-containing protein [Gemmatimonadetes bacterium]|nr:adenylate/guanylate cyclase domain-containing protein [Gemmatimonadota bacterium]